MKLIILHIIFDMFGWFSLWESLISELTVATEVFSKFLCKIFKQQKCRKRMVHLTKDLTSQYRNPRRVFL